MRYEGSRHALTKCQGNLGNSIATHIRNPEVAPPLVRPLVLANAFHGNEEATLCIEKFVDVEKEVMHIIGGDDAALSKCRGIVLQ
jgi:hypothetical protein